MTTVRELTSNAIVELIESYKPVGNRMDQMEGNLKSQGVNVLFPPPPLIGCKGDGIADDTAAFKAAVNYLAQTGGVVNLPDGTYLLNTSDLADSGASLAFANLNNIHFKGSGNSVIKGIRDRIIATFDNCSDLTFEGLTFDGAKATIDPTVFNGHGLYFHNNAAKTKIVDCKFKNFGDSAIIDRTQSRFDSGFPNATDVKKSYIIIDNCHFDNVKMAYNNKGGGSKFGILANNHVYNSLAGFKIDGETFETTTPSVTYKTFPSFAGGFIISNNTFSNMVTTDANSGIGLGAIALEEHIDNIIVSGNIFEDLTNVDCILISMGQSAQDVKNLKIHNNSMLRCKNSTGISIRNEAGANIEMSNLEITNNTFKNFNHACVFLKNTNGILKDVLIRGNRFIDWSLTPVVGSGVGDAIHIWTPNKIDNLDISQNLFARYSTVYQNRYAINTNNAVVDLKEDFIINQNKFILKTDADVIMALNGTKALLQDNYFELGVIYSYGSVVEFLRNRNEGSRIFLEPSTSPNTITMEGNRFYKNGIVHAYAVKVNDGGAVTGRNNYFEPSFTDPVYTPSGSYKDATELILTSPNGTHYKITVSDAGVLTVTSTVI